MRSFKKFFVVACGLLAIAAVGFIGCSDDLSSSGSSGISDPNFENVQTEINGFIENNLDLFSTGLNIIDVASDLADTAVVNILNSAVDPDSISNSNGWYVLHTNNNDLQTGITNTVLDSIRFQRDGAWQDSPTDADGMNIRHHWTYSESQSQQTYSSYTNTANLSLHNVDLDTVTISGTASMSAGLVVINTDSTVIRNYTVSSTFTMVNVDNSEGNNPLGCPYSGTVTSNIQLVYQWGTASPDTTNWVVTSTFNEGVTRNTVTLGDQQRSYDCTYCNPNTSH